MAKGYEVSGRLSGTDGRSRRVKGKRKIFDLPRENFTALDAPEV